MSVSQNNIIPITNQLKTAKKGKDSCWCLSVGAHLSLQSCFCICCVLCEHFVFSDPHLRWSSFVQSSPGHGSRGLLAMHHPWRPGPASVVMSLEMTPDLAVGALRTKREPPSCRRRQGEPPGGVVRQSCRAPGNVSGMLGIARLNVPVGHAPLVLTHQRNLNCLILSEPQGPGWPLHRIQGVACPCLLQSQPHVPRLQCSQPRCYP